jgi:uncharacterized protein (DUF302 family)
MHIGPPLALSLLVLLSGCGVQEPPAGYLYVEVDEVFEAIQSAAGKYNEVVSIDHSRLAAMAGETMPPARVYIFSDPVVNTAILREQPLAGLDLPFRILSYAEEDEPAVLYTSAEFIEHRHGLTKSVGLRQYDDALGRVLEQLTVKRIDAVDVSRIERGYGINELPSSYGFDETVARLKEEIFAEEDTIWFGEIDYQVDAAALGVELPPLKLLLFGAPGPGAKAMSEFPRMGLDAFCQKLLVHESGDGRVTAYFNAMPAFAQMHYGEKALPHHVINRRMGATLRKATE